MKSAFLTLALACTTALAATTELRPAGPTSGTYRWQCAATGFRDAQTIAGVCMERQYSAGSGRGGGYRPPTLIGIWPTAWDHTGAPTVDFGSTTLWPGCQGTGETAEVNGTYYYFIAADSLGDELVETSCVSYLVTP